MSSDGFGMGASSGGDDEPLISLKVRRHLQESPERAFDAFLDPKIAGKFLFATPGGVMQKVEIDGRVGGRFTIVERRDGVDVEHVGKFFEVRRPNRIVFTFSVPTYSDGADLLYIDIAADGEGSEVVIDHEVEPQYAEQAEAGWQSILEGLAKALGEK